MDSNLKIKNCKNCKAEFKQKKEWQKYCKPTCKTAVNNARRAIRIRQAFKALQAQEAGR